MPGYVFIVDRIFLFSFLVIAPSIAAAIGYAAWKGKPGGFDRSTYWLIFAVVVVASGLLMAYAARLQADVRTLQYAWQAACFELGALMFGVAAGCAIGAFAYKRSQ